MKIQKEAFPLCRTHRQPAWQAVVEERGHGAAKRSIFVPICRECRSALPKHIRRGRVDGTPLLMTLVAARELARSKNATHIAAIASKAAATRRAKRLPAEPARSEVVASAIALINEILPVELPGGLDGILNDGPLAELTNFRWTA